MPTVGNERMTHRRVGKSNRFLNLAHAQLGTLSALIAEGTPTEIRNNPLVIAVVSRGCRQSGTRSGVSAASLVGDRK
jgi:hypothetical protein